MATSVTTLNPTPSPIICDFGWYYGTLNAPLRLPEQTFTVGSSNYPPAHTTLSSGVTLPTGSPVAVASTAGFSCGGGPVMFYGGQASNAHSLAAYTIVDSTHLQITGGSGTFTAGIPVYDPRFYVDALPMQVNINFDAVDSNSLGIPSVRVPSGVTIRNYRWDLGNGTIGYGPIVSATYTYAQPPKSITVSLTVEDNLNRRFSCAHALMLQTLIPLFANVQRQSVSNRGYR